MFRRKSLPLGVLVMLLVLALATLGIGYGMWDKTLTIDGTVNTGDVNAEFSLHEVDEGLERGSANGPTDDDVNEDKEAIDPVTGLPKDIAECTVALLDGLINPGNQLMEVTIDEGYPSFHCYVDFDVHNNGSIPIKVHSPVISGAPAWLTVEMQNCYTDHDQLENCEEALCTLHVHIIQGAPQDSSTTFTGTIFVHQWNEP